MADNTLYGFSYGGGSSGTGSWLDSEFTLINSTDSSKRAKFSCGSIATGTTRTFTFPNATDTLICADATQTLKNKQFEDSSFNLYSFADSTKKAYFSLSSIPTGVTQAWTFPNDTAGDVLVGLSLSQTLANKKLSDTTTTFCDNVGTKQFKVDCASITAGNTRTWTVPDANSTFVGIATTQTLTNKTIVNADNTITSDVITCSSSSWTTPISSKDYSFNIRRWGQMVTVSFPLKSGTTNSTNGFSILGIIPAGYRPASQQEFVIRIQNGSFASGLVIINTSGDINFYSDTSGSIWPSSAVAFRIGNTSVSYLTSIS